MCYVFVHYYSRAITNVVWCRVVCLSIPLPSSAVLSIGLACERSHVTANVDNFLVTIQTTVCPQKHPLASFLVLYGPPP